MIGLEFILNTYNEKKSNIADMLGIPRPNISAWLKNERKIPEKWLSELSEYFNLPAYLFQKELSQEEEIKIFLQRNAEISFDKSPEDLMSLIDLRNETMNSIGIMSKSLNGIPEEEREEAISTLKRTASALLKSKYNLDVIASLEKITIDEKYILISYLSDLNYIAARTLKNGNGEKFLEDLGKLIQKYYDLVGQA